jgi:hypothetical protein
VTSLSHYWVWDQERIVEEISAGSADDKELRLILETKNALALAKATEAQAKATVALVEATTRADEKSAGLVTATHGLKWATWALALFAAAQVLLQVFWA